ncbi:MAG: helix-turn-helix transcriptional regulator [Clostridiales bacterium]|nr:helix-turn-helix transcriptional regulator [Clostridiales bacterium]
MNLNKAFAIRLSKLLVEKNISKYRLEKDSGISHSALRYIFNEVNNDVKFSTIVKVCDVLNISLKDFFDDDIFKMSNLQID